MSDNRAILIRGIIRTLENRVREQNAELCKRNLYSEQIAFDGGDMFFTLVFMSTEQLREIAKACGL